MSLKIVTFTLILMLFLSPTIQMVGAQENETLPDGTNSTIPDSLLGLNVTLVNTTSTEVNGTETDGEPLNPIILTMIRDQAQNRSQEMLLLLGNSTLPPDIANSLMHARQAMEQAQSFEGNNSRAAAQQYLRAMKQYRNALRKYLHDNPDVLPEPAVNGTASDDINGTVTEEEINSAKIQLINQFQERFQEQIAAMIDNVDNATGDMSPDDASKAQQALSKAEQKLLRIQERILNGQYDDALDDLDNTTSTLDDELNNMTDSGTAQMLRTMNQLEAKIAKMEQKAEKKAAKGESTAEEDALLAELRGNKDHTKNDFKDNQGKGNNSGNSGNNGNNGKPDNTGKPDKDKPDKGKGKGS